MQVEFEDVDKVPAFKPFSVKVTFETPQDIHAWKIQCNTGIAFKIIGPENDYSSPVNMISREIKRRGH